MKGSRCIVGCGGRTETDGLEDDGRVQSQSVEGNIEGEPGPSSTEKNLEVLPLTKVTTEIGERSLGQGVSSFHILLCVKRDIAVVALVINILFVGDNSVGIIDTPLDIGFDIECVSGSLGDGQSEVESDEGGDTAQADDDSPCLIDSL